MIAIVNYKMGNINSILTKLQKMKIQAYIASNGEELEHAEKIILPGVGNFLAAMENIRKLGFDHMLRRRVLHNRVPILGICLGLQLFTKKSEEGHVNGLGWLNAETKRFDSNTHHLSLRVPHVGWNVIKVVEESRLLDGIPNGSRFYFTHSYHLSFIENDSTTARTDYGYEFPSVVEDGNICGTQFHPEKSHKFGMKILQNFVENY